MLSLSLALACLGACDRHLDAGHDLIAGADDAGPPDAAEDGPPLHGPAAGFTVDGVPAPLQLNGDAHFDDERLVLTEAQKNLAGTAFLAAPLPVAGDRALQVHLVFHIEPSAYAADGLALVWHAHADGPGALSGNGGSLAVRDIVPGVALLFDTVDASGGFEAAPGVRIDRLGREFGKPLAMEPFPFEVTTGQPVYVWAEHRAGLLQVFVADAPEKPDAPFIQAQVDLASTVGQEVFVGVGSATGEGFSRHVVRGLHVTSRP